MPEDRAPSVAVVIPCRDEAATIGACIRSVRSQVPPPAAVVVVDDGSTDGSDATAAELADVVVRPERRATIGGLRNMGVAATDAPVLAFLDADCVAQPGWLAAGIAALADADLTGHRVEAPADGSWVARRWGAVEQRLAGDRPMIWSANMMVRRTAFEAVGGFDEALRTGEDVDFSARAARAGLRVSLNPRMRVVHHGFPETVAAFIRRERWHASTPGWWSALSSRGRLLVMASAALAALGAGAAAAAVASRRPGVLGAYVVVTGVGTAALGAITGGGRQAPQDGLLLLVWGLARASRLRRGRRRR